MQSAGDKVCEIFLMLRLAYLVRNLFRNPLRTLLTCAAVALPITIYVLSNAVVIAIDRLLENSSKQLRLAVTHKSSVVNPLPTGHRAKIESLDKTGTRLVSVNGTRFIGGRIDGKAQQLSTVAVDADTFLLTFPETALTESEMGEWIRHRNAFIAGAGTAGQFGWRIGDRITMRSSFPPYSELEYLVVAISRSTTDLITNFCRRDYVQAEAERVYGSAAEDFVSFIFVKCATQADLDFFRGAIDELFARSPDETKTQDEKTFMNEFIKQQFDMERNLSILSAVTVFVAVMAAANTMSMNFRDRLTELAALKALGFTGLPVFALIQSESLFLCLAGGFVGAFVPYFLFTFTPLRDMTVPLIQHLYIHPRVCLEAMLIAGLIGIVAAIWPALSAVRLKPVQALRNLE